MKDCITLSTIDEIKAYSDPYRMQILNCFHDMRKPATVKQVADKMGEVPAKVYYHVKKLEKYGLLTLVNTEVINGIVAKYYEPGAKYINIDNDKIDNATKKVFENEVQKVIHHNFIKAENNFMDSIKKLEKFDEKDKEKRIKGGTLSIDTVYVSDEEIVELKNYLADFMEKHSQKCNGKTPYQIFNTIVNMEEIDKE